MTRDRGLTLTLVALTVLAVALIAMLVETRLQHRSADQEILIRKAR